MKQLFLFMALIILGLSACSNPRSAPFLEDQFDKAVAFNDYTTALVYLHELRALDNNNHTVYVRLSDLYSKMGNHKGALVAVDIALKAANDLEKKDLMFTKFRAKKALKQNADAVAILDTLIELDKERELEYMYEAAVLYFEMKDMGNAQMRMEKVLRHPLALQSEKTLLSDFGQDKVSYRAAADNFIAYIKILTGDYNTAELMYDELLKKYPNFKLAQSNYNLLQKQKALKAQEGQKSTNK